MKIFEIFNTQI